MRYETSNSDLRVFYELDGGLELHIILTHEGVVMDLVGARKGEVIATSSETAEEIASRLDEDTDF